MSKDPDRPKDTQFIIRVVESFEIHRLNSIEGILRASLIIVVPTFIIGGLLELFGIIVFHPIVSIWPFENKVTKALFGYLDILIFGPLIESAILFLPIFILKTKTNNKIAAASISSAIWAILHYNGNSAIPSLFSIWPFFCMSIPAFESKKSNRTKTWLKICAIHSTCNLAMVGAIHLTLLIR